MKEVLRAFPNHHALSFLPTFQLSPFGDEAFTIVSAMPRRRTAVSQAFYNMPHDQPWLRRQPWCWTIITR